MDNLYIIHTHKNIIITKVVSLECHEIGSSFPSMVFNGVYTLTTKDFIIFQSINILFSLSLFFLSDIPRVPK